MTANQVQIRRDTATNLNSSTPADGELAYDTTNDQLRIGNGSTLGGVRMPNSIMLQNQSMVAATAGGTADALTLTLDPAPTAYVSLQRFVFKAAATNTLTTSTLNVNGLGAKTIKKKGTSGKIAIAVGDIQNGVIYAATYDGTDFQLETVASSSGGVIDAQTFTANGSWTKPGSGTMAYIQIWSAGGSGASRSTTGNAAGGGGGGYLELWVPMSALSSSETVVVGAGGAGVSGNTNGNPGGTSSFTIGSKTVQVSGAGQDADGNTAFVATQGTTATATSGGTSGMPRISGGDGGGTNTSFHDTAFGSWNPLYGATKTASNPLTAAQSASAGLFGSSGGGTGASGGSCAGGAGTIHGGGGGGSSSSGAGGTRTGGTSILGGNGGAGGANTGGNGTAGTAPGGGGGGAVQGGTSGAGARGEVRVTVF